MSEIIIAIISSTALTTVVTTLVNRRTMKIEDETKDDMNWKERIKFLNESIANLETRTKKLEELVCYNETCKRRLSE